MITEFAEYMEDFSLGTRGTDIFIGKKPSEITFNNIIGLYEVSSAGVERELDSRIKAVQVYIRNSSYVNGIAKCEQVVTLLHKNNNNTLVSGGNYYYYIFMESEPVALGRDEQDRSEWSINFVAKYR